MSLTKITDILIHHYWPRFKVELEKRGIPLTGLETPWWEEVPYKDAYIIHFPSGRELEFSGQLVYHKQHFINALDHEFQNDLHWVLNKHKDLMNTLINKSKLTFDKAVAAEAAHLKQTIIEDLDKQIFGIKAYVSPQAEPGKLTLSGINEAVKELYEPALQAQLHHNPIWPMDEFLPGEDYVPTGNSYRVWGGPLEGEWVAQPGDKQWFLIPYVPSPDCMPQIVQMGDFEMPIHFETTYKEHRYELRAWTVDLPREVRMVETKYGTQDMEVDWEDFEGRVWVSAADHERLVDGLRVLRMLLCLLQGIPLV